jgi:cytochrome P450
MDGIVGGPEVTRILDELTTMVGREDPYPRYRRLRQISPVVRAEDGALVVTRYADCSVVTRDPRFAHLPPDMLAFIGNPDWAQRPALRQLFTSMLVLNPPDHTRLRRVVSGAFSARRVQALRPAIEAMVDDLLDPDGRFGRLHQGVRVSLPVNVIGELLGIPAADRARFQPLVRDWAQVLERITPEVLSRADPAATTIRDYLSELVARRRRDPGTDLISALVAAQDEQLTEDEVLTTAALLFAAGFETTTNLLANSLVALLEHPAWLRPLGRSNSRGRGQPFGRARTRLGVDDRPVMPDQSHHSGQTLLLDGPMQCPTKDLGEADSRELARSTRSLRSAASWRGRPATTRALLNIPPAARLPKIPLASPSSRSATACARSCGTRCRRE